MKGMTEIVREIMVMRRMKGLLIVMAVAYQSGKEGAFLFYFRA